MRVFVDVPQSSAADLMAGGVTADVTANDLPGRKFAGKVTRTANAVDPRSRTLRVEVDLANTDHKLVSGQYVSVAFHIATKGVAQVPGAALVFRSSGPEVAVVGSDGKVRFRAVSILRDDGNAVALGTGVSPGEKVVLNVSSEIEPGEAVRVADDDGQLASAATVP